jgi:hypothetical protein
MRQPAFKLCVAVLCFAFGVYASLLWHAFASCLSAPAPRPRHESRRAAEPAAEVCHVHNAAMRAERVPIVYGMTMNTPVRWEAESRLFPNSRRTVRGGCVVMEKKQAEALVCAACRAAEDEWLRQHPNRRTW